MNQYFEKPTIIETGCQRFESDIGAGESTTIFCEYIQRYGGRLISVDISEENLIMAQKCVASYNISKEFHAIDSVEFLRKYQGKCDLVYLDSYDYPYSEMLDEFGGKTDMEAATKQLYSVSPEELNKRFTGLIGPCQQHCLNELLAILPNLHDKSIVLFDDNLLPGGGKPKTAKQYLLANNWTCILDYQQSVWVKGFGLW